jgi:hypothetical protein
MLVLAPACSGSSDAGPGDHGDANDLMDGGASDHPPSDPDAGSADSGADGSSRDAAAAPGTCVPPGDGRLVAGTVWNFLVASDEVHVALLRTDGAWCAMMSSPVNPLATLTVASACQPVSSTTVAKGVNISSVRFSSDGSQLVYVSEIPDPCKQAGNLWVAGADGSGPRKLASNVSAFPSPILAGSTVLYRSGTSTFAVSLAGGTPVDLGVEAVLEPWVHPTGTAVAATVAGRLELVDTATGVHTVLDPVASTHVLWSPRGKFLAWMEGWRLDGPTKLSLADEHGQGRRVLTSTQRGDFLFTGDESKLVFVERAADSTLRAVVHFTTGSEATIIGGLPKDDSAVRFDLMLNADASLIGVQALASSESVSWYFGPTAPGSQLRKLFETTTRGTVALAPSNDYVAYQADDDQIKPSTVHVVPIGGGAGVSIEGRAPKYQPVTANPRLLIYSHRFSSDRAVRLYGTDGAGPPVVVPEANSAEWVGRDQLVYGVLRAGPFEIEDLWVVGADGGGARRVAADVHDPMITKSRIYYLTTTSTTGGELWLANLF